MKVDIISVVGLGYVGLPLASLLATRFRVLGFDINSKRVKQLRSGLDITNEVSKEKLENKNLSFHLDPADMKNTDIFIVAVPTPIEESKKPNLKPLILASQSVGKVMKKGAIVVFESTVYPGVTEDICVKELEKASGFLWKRDFHVGYSPERVNPGDKEHTIDKIVKVVSGDDNETLEILSGIYGTVVTAGIHNADSIKIAEAAKVIENTQRDLNIALMNELSVLFNKLEIDTKKVLAAAATKWNFLNFFPGLVGGHCIGVDPYYLTYKAEEIGYHPEVISSGRRINDNMGKFVAEMTFKNILKAKKDVNLGKILICGFTFKENISDFRNTKVIDVYRELEKFSADVVIYDPLVNPEDVRNEYSIETVRTLPTDNDFLGIIFAVKHDKLIRELTLEKCCSMQIGIPVISDIKGVFEDQELKDIIYFSL